MMKSHRFHMNCITNNISHETVDHMFSQTHTWIVKVHTIKGNKTETTTTTTSFCQQEHDRGTSSEPWTHMGRRVSAWRSLQVKTGTGGRPASQAHAKGSSFLFCNGWLKDLDGKRMHICSKNTSHICGFHISSAPAFRNKGKFSGFRVFNCGLKEAWQHPASNQSICHVAGVKGHGL